MVADLLIWSLTVTDFILDRMLVLDQGHVRIFLVVSFLLAQLMWIVSTGC